MPAEETSPLPSYHSDTLRTQTRANFIRPLSVRASDSSTDCTRPRSIHARKGFNVTLPTPQPTRRISKMSDPTHTQFSLDQPPTITHHARHALALEQWLLASELTPLFVRTRHTLKRTFTVAATSLQTSRGAGCRNARRRRSVFLRARHSTSPREARQAPIYNPCHKSPGAEAARDAMRRERSERAEAARTPGIQHRREHRLRSQQRTNCSEAGWIAAPRGLLRAPPPKRHPRGT